MTPPYTGPGGQPAPQGWAPQPQQQPPQGYAPQGQFQQPPMPPQTVDPNMRIQQGDPRFPKEMWGRTVGEGMQFYNVMKQDFMQRNQGVQPPPQQQPPRAWNQPGQPQQQPIPTFSGHQVPQPWDQPQQPQSGVPLDQVRQIFREELSQIQGPMLQTTAETVRNNVAAGYPDWNNYAADIHLALQGASPQMLLNPESWKMAYFAVKGKALTERPPQPAAQPQVDPFRANGGGTNNGNPGVGQRPAAPQQQQWPQQQPPQPFSGGQSFTEAPVSTAPYAPQAQVDDPRDIIMAARFQIPVEEYRQWKGGNVPPAPQPQLPGPGYQMQGQPPAYAGIPQRW